MKTNFWLSLAFSAVALGTAAAPLEIAPGVHLLRGTFVPGRQPDGNTIVFRGTEGAVVVDTGRHAAHTRAILDFATPKAVLNTHWHLDHIGGNALIRREVPGVTIYASGAIEGARKGFLANYAKQLEDVIARTTGEEQQRYRTELALIESGSQLVPDVVIAESGARAIAGRKLQIHLETDAVTAGDLWILDEASGTLVAGDLVTLPVPFFDTASPQRWQEALGRVARTGFARLVPGHGPVMTPAEFERYRTAYDNLLACAASSRKNEECTAGWLADTGSLVPEGEHAYAGQALNYYLDQHLRPRR